MADVRKMDEELLASEGIFEPDWAMHPSATLREMLEEKGLSHRVFAASMARFGMDPAHIFSVLDGNELYTDSEAEAFVAFLGGSVVLWKNLRDNYSKALARGATDWEKAARDGKG